MKSINWQKLILELIVVFLGVTGGFVLNNWRESSNNRDLEANYIQSFLQNVNSNIEEINGILEDDSLWFESMNLKLKLLAKDSLSVDSQIAVVQSVMYISSLALETSTFEDIKFSGNLNLIHEYQLKESIVKYHNHIDGVLFVDKYFNEYFSNFVLPFVMNNFDMAKNVFFNYDKKLQSNLFNVAGAYYTMRKQRSTTLLELRNKSLDLKSDLEDFLNQ